MRLSLTLIALVAVVVGTVGPPSAFADRRDDVWRMRFAGSSWSCPIPNVPEVVRKDLRLGCPEGGP